MGGCREEGRRAKRRADSSGTHTSSSQTACAQLLDVPRRGKTLRVRGSGEVLPMGKGGGINRPRWPWERPPSRERDGRGPPEEIGRSAFSCRGQAAHFICWTRGLEHGSTGRQHALAVVQREPETRHFQAPPAACSYGAPIHASRLAGAQLSISWQPIITSAPARDQHTASLSVHHLAYFYASCPQLARDPTRDMRPRGLICMQFLLLFCARGRFLPLPPPLS